MNPLAQVDAVYEAFRASLPDALREPARALACTLRLAPTNTVPWSEVFGHAPTLAAPALIAEGLADVAPDALRDATRAHVMAVIHAFGTDRIEDGQVARSDELDALLAAVVRERDAALARLGTDVADEAARADGRVLASLAAERAAFRASAPVTVEHYESVSAGKQQVGLLAAVALARSTGCDAARCDDVRALLEDVAVGLQLRDDVNDWAEDLARGGAWVVLIACNFPHEITRTGMALVDARARIEASGVLPRLLDRAAQRFDAARARAEAMGATTLARWCTGQAHAARNLARGESSSAGYAARMRALAAWALEVVDGG